MLDSAKVAETGSAIFFWLFYSVCILMAIHNDWGAFSVFAFGSTFWVRTWVSIKWSYYLNVGEPNSNV